MSVIDKDKDIKLYLASDRDYFSEEFDFVLNKRSDQLEDQYMVNMFAKAKRLKVLVDKLENSIEGLLELENSWDVDDPEIRENLSFKFKSSPFFSELGLVESLKWSILKEWINYYSLRRNEGLLTIEIVNDDLYEYIFNVRFFNLYKRIGKIKGLCLKSESKWMLDSYSSIHQIVEELIAKADGRGERKD